MPVVEEYWVGVLQRMQAEVDVFARLVRHAGEQGRENELALARVLENLLPGRLGVGTGLLIDTQDHYSKQMDVVLFEQVDEPLLMAQTSQLLFPVEVVANCVEVKTTLRQKDIEDTSRKVASVKALVPAGDEHAGGPEVSLLSYAVHMSPGTALKHFRENEPQPDLVCILQPGLVGGRGLQDSLPGAPDDFGLAAVLLQDGAGGYVPDPGSATAYAQHEGRLYPRTEHDGGIWLGDPARALLVFMDLLMQRSAARFGHRPPILSRYLSAQARTMEWLTEE